MCVCMQKQSQHVVFIYLYIHIHICEYLTIIKRKRGYQIEEVARDGLEGGYMKGAREEKEGGKQCNSMLILKMYF